MLNIDHSRESGFRRLLQSGGAKVAAVSCVKYVTRSFQWWNVVILIEDSDFTADMLRTPNSKM